MELCQSQYELAQVGPLGKDEFSLLVEDFAELLKSRDFCSALICASNSLAYAALEALFFQIKKPLIILPTFFSASQKLHCIQSSTAELIISDCKLPLELDPFTELHGITFSSINPQNKQSLPENCARISFTSGSTGSPKGICLTPEMIQGTAESLCEALECTPADRFMSFMPYAILLESMTGLYLPALCGGTSIICEGISEPLTDARFVYQQLTKHRVSITVMMPHMLQAFIDYLNENLLDCPSCLRFIGVGGAAIPVSLLERAELKKIPVFEGYGLTEAASVVCLNTRTARKIGSPGRPLKHLNVSIGENSEILLEGQFDSCLIDGSQPFIKNGLLHTGDRGSIDQDGFLHIAGRLKNIFISSNGRNISPEWLEHEFMSEPGCKLAIVYGEGLLHPRVLIKLNAGTDAASLLAKVNERLPAYARCDKYSIIGENFINNENYFTPNGRPKRNQIIKSEITHDCL